MNVIRTLDRLGRDDLATAGGKGANLGELVRAEFPVPPGFVVTTAAYREFVTANELAETLGRLGSASDPDTAGDQIATLFAAGAMPRGVAGEIVDAYAALGDQVPVAVRSSATAEDLPEASFAGQQDTYLNVRGAESLLAAVRNCWASLWTPRAIAYRARQGSGPGEVSLAVVVQRMVEAEAAGVMFTANPTNGRRDEVVIGAAWGLGESVVGGTVNTDDMVVSTAGDAVLSRQTADKAVMTVYAPDGTEEVEVPGERRGLPVLSDVDAIALARLGGRVAAHFRAPQDIEWAQVGGGFFLLQSRPITALPEPEGQVPSDWPMPDPRSLYFRASIVEQLPDPLSPLFADLAADSVPRSLQSLMRGLVGRDLLRDSDVGFPTINGYAYYGYTWGGMGRMMLALPMALRWLGTGSMTFGIEAWRAHAHPRYATIVHNWTDRDLEPLTEATLVDAAVELLDAGTAYYTSVQTIIPLAGLSELLFSSFYGDLVRRPGDPPATIFLLGYDSTPIRAEKSLFDLATWSSAQPGLADDLLRTPVDRLVGHLQGGEPPQEVDESTWLAWLERFRAHLDRFGHAVYNLDFVNAVPADDPAPLLQTLRFYLGGGGSDPYQRQRASAERREEATSAVLARLDPVRRRVFTRLLRWAQQTAPVREDALADVGLAWPQLRRILRELGRRLVTAGAIEGDDDVFWLRRAEIEEALASSVPLGSVITQRKIIWRGQRRATPPQMLPEGQWSRWLKDMMPAISDDQTGSVIKGIGASGGQVRAPARVLGGPADFGQMHGGDVLVASITTPAWTPLFAMASGVVTDIGGPLSHSSIVAREYGIPAVLGTGVATRRIGSGQPIAVDGDAGTVRVLDGTAPSDADLPAQQETSVQRSTAVTLAAAGLFVGAGAVVVWLLRRSRRTTRG